MRRPVAEVAFGDTPAAEWAESLVSLSVDSALAPGASWVELVAAAGEGGGGGLLESAAGAVGGALGGGLGGAVGGALGGDSAGGPSAEPGDAGTVALGYADGDAEPVFAGEVESARHALDGTLRLTAADGGGALARLRLNRGYQDRSAGDVVRDLAGEAGVASGTVEAGVALSYFAVDDRLTAWEAIAELARRSSYLARIDARGELVFAPFAPGSPVQTFGYGTDILGLSVRDSLPAVAGVMVVGEGAAGSQGSEAASWLVKDAQSVTSEAGEAPRRLRFDGALRSAAAAQSAASGHLAAAELADAVGELLVPGAPLLSPGSSFEIAGAPGAAFDGEYLVRRVRHSFDKRRGFTTRVWFGRAAAAGGGGLLGALAGALP